MSPRKNPAGGRGMSIEAGGDEDAHSLVASPPNARKCPACTQLHYGEDDVCFACLETFRRKEAE